MVRGDTAGQQRSWGSIQGPPWALNHQIVFLTPPCGWTLRLSPLYCHFRTALDNVLWVNFGKLGDGVGAWGALELRPDFHFLLGWPLRPEEGTVQDRVP